MRIDHVMIKEMLNTEAVGQYAVVVKISEVAYIMFFITINSLAPIVFKLYSTDSSRENNRKTRNFTMVISFIFLFLYSIFLYLISHYIIPIAFGKSYLESIEIFKIHIFSNIFAIIGLFTHQWYLAKGLQNLTFLRVMLGAVINIVLNIILIPLYGTKDAAISTVISYCYVSIFSMLHHPSTRENFKLFLSSLYYPLVIVKRIKF